MGRRPVRAIQRSRRPKARPVSVMLWNSFVMAMVIAVGKIIISMMSAFAIVYFRFPFRMFFFWLIFITLMLPVEVRILPTFQVVAGLGLVDTYFGLTVPLIASATHEHRRPVRHPLHLWLEPVSLAPADLGQFGNGRDRHTADAGRR